MKELTLKGIKFEDFTNYKKGAMFLAFPKCSWKCEKDCGIKGICQNSELALQQNYTWSIESIIQKYQESPFTEAVVCGGLEPFDSFNQLLLFIEEFRKVSDDDIVIYTGYNKEEIIDKINILQNYNNIIIKYGRFIPNQKSKYDDILGITLASPNQYAEVL